MRGVLKSKDSGAGALIHNKDRHALSTQPYVMPSWFGELRKPET